MISAVAYGWKVTSNAHKNHETEGFKQRAEDVDQKAVNIHVANIICSSIQPLQNRAVLNCIEEKVGPDEKFPWAKFRIEKGFGALEKLLKDHAGRYATGDEVSMADAFLAPQIDAGIKRFNVDMVKFPNFNLENFLCI
ncbi:glutathione S-transferase zeta class-like [Hibiscus syriacus]|uniref:glutathione S-transferase zeta class-like n=1 Tax=Hibiscus syriacus TaxID=106335 RepID=UPI0019219896|nr:glutathione S-transferase zeta class-like [Hibiscus syriacus]